VPSLDVKTENKRGDKIMEIFVRIEITVHNSVLAERGS
jgi:hypothetical protein